MQCNLITSVQLHCHFSMLKKWEFVRLLSVVNITVTKPWLTPKRHYRMVCATEYCCLDCVVPSEITAAKFNAICASVFGTVIFSMWLFINTVACWRFLKESPGFPPQPSVTDLKVAAKHRPLDVLSSFARHRDALQVNKIMQANVYLLTSDTGIADSCSSNSCPETRGCKHWHLLWSEDLDLSHSLWVNRVSAVVNIYKGRALTAR